MRESYIVTWVNPLDGDTEYAVCDTRECADEWVRSIGEDTFDPDTGECTYPGAVATVISRPVQSLVA